MQHTDPHTTVKQQLLDFDAAVEKKPRLHRRGYAETSRDAFREVAPKLSERAARVLGYLRGRGRRGATLYEISRDVGLRYASTPSVVLRLRGAGLVVDSGGRRATDTGSMAVVWVAEEAAP